jgi:pSer/pThr/pTyr-binding forkhead associated (FHA) protein
MKILVTQQAFILIVEDDKGRREIPLGDAVYSIYSIGTDPQSDIRLFSQFVSKRHATLVRRHHEDGSVYYIIVDGNLKGKLSVQGLLINGQKLQCLLINGQKLQIHHLENEDEIVFGPGVMATY